MLLHHCWSCLPTSVWRPPIRSTRRVGGRPPTMLVQAVQLRTPYESASFDDWELRAEIEEELKRKQAKIQHEARRRGGDMQRGHAQFYAAEQAAYRERKAREDAFARYLDTVADRAKRSARAATEPPKRPQRQRSSITSDPAQLQGEAEAAYHLLAAKTNRFSQYVSALERRKQRDTSTDRRGRRISVTSWQSISMDEGVFGTAPVVVGDGSMGGTSMGGQACGNAPPAWRRGTDIMFDPKHAGSFDGDDDFVWADEV